MQAAHDDVPPKSAKGEAVSLASALASALGSVPGSGKDLENIEFLVHVLSVNRASGSIDDETFERLLELIKTKDGRADLADRFARELETEHGYEDED